MELQSFYTDGASLMVVIPPNFLGSKIPGYLCRVFCLEDGKHLYDISMGDSPEDTRKEADPRKNLGSGGASCYDPVNDLAWHLDVDGSRARRWCHPDPYPQVFSANLTTA